MTSKLTSDERLVKILSETQATIMEHNSRCVRGSVEVDARLFESMIMELQERRKADSEPVAEVLSNRQGNDTSTIDRALPVGTQLYRHAQPVVPPMQHWEELCREYPDMSIGDAIIRAAWWNHCRAAMLQAGYAVRDLSTPVDPQVAEYEQNVMQAGNSPVIPGRWIPVSERMPEKNGTYQVWNGKHVGAVPFLFGSFQCLNPEQVTHWMPTAKPPREVK
ncbi:TPA: DUF551 domain-containing protein [Raoultella planticola]